MLPLFVLFLSAVVFLCIRQILYVGCMRKSEFFLTSALTKTSCISDFNLEGDISSVGNMPKDKPILFTSRDNLVMILKRGNTCSEIPNR